MARLRRMSKARVLHLITHLGIGGAQDNTLLTAERLSRERFDVHLAAGQDHADWHERARASSDALHLVPTLHVRPVPWTDLRCLREIKRLLDGTGYDIVHTHSSKAGVLGRLAARRARVPVVVHTIHGLPWHDWMSPARRWTYILLERYAAGASDALITVSESNRREAIDLGLAPPEKLVTIYSGIDLQRHELSVSRDEKCGILQLDARRPIVGTVGRLADQKAPLDFERSWLTYPHKGWTARSDCCFWELPWLLAR